MHFKKAQSILDYALVFIAVSALILGIVRIWIWFNANYAKRQAAFQQSRLTATNPTETLVTSGTWTETVSQMPYDKIDAPVNIGYQPLDLTEDWVFKGIPSGTVSASVDNAIVSAAAITDAGNTACQEQCASAPGCVGEAFNTDCSCYQKCFAKYNCLAQNEGAKKSYEKEAENLQKQAENLRVSADSMEETADDCKNIWDACWWGDWGKTYGEVMEGVKSLRAMAKELDTSADKLIDKVEAINICCENTDSASQSECLEKLQEPD